MTESDVNSEAGIRDEDHQKLELLKLAHETQVNAVIFHNNLGFNMFSWSTTLLLAVMGFLLTYASIFDSTKRVLISIAILVLIGIIFSWQRHNNLEGREHKENLSYINEIFQFNKSGAYGGSRAIYERKRYIWEPLELAEIGLNVYNIVLIILLLITLIILWIL